MVLLGPHQFDVNHFEIFIDPSRYQGKIQGSPEENNFSSPSDQKEVLAAKIRQFSHNSVFIVIMFQSQLIYSVLNEKGVKSFFNSFLWLSFCLTVNSNFQYELLFLKKTPQNIAKVYGNCNPIDTHLKLTLIRSYIRICTHRITVNVTHFSVKKIKRALVFF